MTRITPEVADTFKGIAKDIPSPKLPAGFYQEDEGGDRFSRGAYKRRRGMRHTDIAKQASAVTSILGFDLAGPDYALLLVEGNNVQGFTNVAQLADTTDTGYGAGGYGGSYG